MSDLEKNPRGVKLESAILPFNPEEIRLPIEVSEVDQDRIAQAMMDPNGLAIAPLWEELITTYGPVFLTKNRKYNIYEVHVADYDLMIQILGDDDSFHKPPTGKFDELIGGSSLFGGQTNDIYKGRRKLEQDPFSKKIARERFPFLVQATRDHMKGASADVSLADFSRRLSARYSEIIFGQQFPPEVTELAMSMLPLFFAAREMDNPDPSTVSLYENNLALMQTKIGEMVKNYLKKDVLGTLIYERIGEMGDTVDYERFPADKELAGKIFSTIFGGFETVGFEMGLINVALSRQPDVRRQLNADILAATGGDPKNFTHEVLEQILSVQNFIDHITNIGPSYELQRTVGSMNPADGMQLVKIGDYRIPNFNMVRIHLAYATEKKHGLGLNTPINLNRSIGERGGFGHKRRQCIGKTDTEAFIMAYLAALTLEDKEPQLNPVTMELKDQRASVRGIDPRVQVSFIPAQTAA